MVPNNPGITACMPASSIMTDAPMLNRRRQDQPRMRKSITTTTPRTAERDTDIGTATPMIMTLAHSRFRRTAGAWKA